MKNKGFQTGCIMAFDPAKREVFRFGGVSVGRCPIPGWKMDSVFRVLSDGGYGDPLFTSSVGGKTGLVLFVRRKKDEGRDEGRDFACVPFDEDPNKNYFRLNFVPGKNGMTVSLSHSFCKMHDISLNEMVEGEDNARGDEKDTDKAWERAREFRDSHSFDSLSFPMTDKGVSDLKDAVRRTIEYIEKQWC